METKQIQNFDTFSVCPSEQKLWKGDIPIPLTPKVFRTLLYLLENRHRIVTKDELITWVWPDRVVEEANLTQNISVLRKALGESVTGKKYIATFPGRGYRFLPDVNDDHPEVRNPIEPEPVELAPPIAAPGSRAGRWKIAFLVLLGCVTAILLWRPTSFRPASRLEISERQVVVRQSGASYQPAWSRDGKSLTFVHTSDDSPDSIYVKSEEGLSPRLVFRGSGSLSSPTWSPDGKKIAFLEFTNTSGNVKVVNVGSGQVASIANVFRTRYGLECRQLDWSPDGQFLAVTDKSRAEEAFRVFLISLADGRRWQLTYPSMDIIGDVMPRFSPDGGQLAFVRIKYQFQFDAFTIPVTGGESTRVTDDERLISDVDWLSGSNDLLLSSNRKDGFRLWRANSGHQAGRDLEQIAGISSDTALTFALSKKGQIAFSNYQSNLNIWEVTLPGKPGGEVAWRPLIESPSADFAPQYSADGQYIAFRSGLTGLEGLWISSVDGEHTREVTHGTRAGLGAWSRESLYVFSALPNQGVFIFDPRNSGLRRLTVPEQGHPAFSSDGKWVYSHKMYRVYRTPVDGGKSELITDRGGFPLIESKDGRFLYFTRGRLDHTIWRLDLETKQVQAVVDDLLPGYWGCWSLLDDAILYLTERNGTPWIFRRQFKDPSSVAISPFQGGMPPIGTSVFSVSPDQRKLLTVRADTANSVIESARISD